jgi:hypothetical protein
MNMNKVVGQRDLVFLTFDTLRFDVADAAMNAGETPNLASVLPSGKWEKRHSPGSFTYASHHAFFAGFLPTPAEPIAYERLFAARFAGSETTGSNTCIFDAPDIVSGLAQQNYRTICIGGVGFFSKSTPLSCVLPDMFHESHWSQEMGVTDPDSTQNQFELAAKRLSEIPSEQRIFLFINISALHQPNKCYLPGTTEDNLDSHRAALRYVDAQMPILWEALQKRGPSFHIYCSDHGTAYGEDGFQGHRLAHPVVWEVPYGEFLME